MVPLSLFLMILQNGRAALLRNNFLKVKEKNRAQQILSGISLEK